MSMAVIGVTNGALTVMGAAYHSSLPRSNPHFLPCEYCSREADVGQQAASCNGCGGPLKRREGSFHSSVAAEYPQQTLKLQEEKHRQKVRHSEEVASQKRRKDEEETVRKRRRDEEDEASRKRSHNTAMGDMLNTGIPGGIDMDITTPL